MFMTEEERMAKEIDGVVETLKELEPISIVLMGSFARQEWTSKSDAELAVIFEDTNYHSRTELKKYATRLIVHNLRMKNSEFRELHDYLKDRALPRLAFWSSEHPLHFKPGIKQRWVKK